MAFIISSLPVVKSSRTHAGTCTTGLKMSANPISRRAALRAAAFGLAGAAAAAFAADEKIDLKELKEGVEELKYDEEVTEVGPDPAEKNILRTKKKEVDPAYVAEEKKILKESEEAYGEMLKEEESEAAILKEKFSK